MLLSDYITQVRLLVHDVSAQDWTDAELIGHINNSRTCIALDTHCVRQFATGLDAIANQETYPISGGVGGIVVTAGGTLYTSAPTVTFTGGSPTTAATATAVVTSGAVSAVYMTSWGAGYSSAPAIGFTGGGGSGATATATTLINVLDIGGLSLLYTNWRGPLRWRPFGAFQAFCRADPLLRTIPAFWTNYTEQNLFYLYPIPDSSNTYKLELDVVVLPNALAATTDSDTQITMPYADAVQYYASYLALTKLQNMDQAYVFLNRYKSRVKQIAMTRQTARIQDAYRAYYGMFGR